METQMATRRELETALIEKCWKDPEFKKRVVSDPKEMLERYTGKKLPPEVKIFVHEEDQNTLHFSIPGAPTNLTELSDEQLERVAGGQIVINPDDPLNFSLRPPDFTGSADPVNVPKAW